jgi:hypothetical protein
MRILQQASALQRILSPDGLQRRAAFMYTGYTGY